MCPPYPDLGAGSQIPPSEKAVHDTHLLWCGRRGTRAEHLRLIAGELQMADVRTNVALSAFTDFEDFTILRPGAHQVEALDRLFSEVIAWSDALAPLRRTPRAA